MVAQTIKPLEPPPPDGVPITDPVWRDWFSEVWEALGSDGRGTFPRMQVGRATFAASNDFQSLLGVDNGLYVKYSATFAQTMYGFVCDVHRAKGTNPIYGARLRSWTEKGVTGDQWGVATEAISRPGSNNANVAIEGACTVLEDATQKPKTGQSLIFKDRLDGATAAGSGLGNNRYNYFARGVVLTSQARSTSAEFCGWNVGIDFGDYWGDQELVPAWSSAVTYLPGQCVSDGGTVWKAITTSLNQLPAVGSAFWVLRTIGTTNNLAVGIDFSSMSTGAMARMASAIRLRALQRFHWEESGQMGTYFDSATGVLHLATNAANSKFSVDMVSGAGRTAGDMSVGLATLPAHEAASPYLFVGPRGSIGTSVVAGAQYVQLSQNTVFDGVNHVYVAAAATAQMHMNGAAIGFRRAASGAAGATITWLDSLQLDANGNAVLGTLAAVATNATDGFAYIPTCAGAPTGVPTAFVGKVPLIYDTTNQRLYAYNGAWRSTLFA